MTNLAHPVHPGLYIRKNVLNPLKLTVTETAKLVGISRPGISNFLNGKVSATADMAARFENVFGLPAKTILDMQANYDAHMGKTTQVVQNTRKYVPPFLNIKANELEDWFTRTNYARTQLSVLLRILIHSTGRDLLKIDFPGNDDAERPGWDGLMESGCGTPWIPSGISGWEFGVTKDIKDKAKSDFAKRVKATSKTERQNITFVFVTPRRWSGKSVWVADMAKQNLWKEVRAYDSSDLEQWIEQSLGAQTWFANRSERLSNGVRTLDQCWDDWSQVSAPPLPIALFATANGAYENKIKSFFTEKSSAPLMIRADSAGEALAFLSQVLSRPQLEQYKDRVLVFDEPGVLPKLAQGTTDFIAVVHTREVERELGPYSASLPTVVIYSRNATIQSKEEIVLEPLGYEAFSKALKEMGKSRDEITRLSHESGRSLTVLRRRLSHIPAIRTPEWAVNHETARSLVPLVLLGTWDTKNKVDQTVLSRLANVSFEILEKHISKLLRLNDAPVWSISGYGGVVSKIDSLFAIADAITREDLDQFFDVAKDVLGEDDPALDLPEKDRWAAAIHGKQRAFSASIRDGISETLVLLAVHGESLFNERLGFDGEREVAQFIRELLEPVQARKLEANQRDFPLYAEAAPVAFLDIIDSDLRSKKPEVMALFRPVNGFFDSCPRTGLLWALEGLAWSTLTFPRVVKILAQLSEIEINDNLANRPINSLESIFCAWMPQTAANYTMRLKAIRMLIKEYPTVGWKICLQQFGHYGNCFCDYNYKPRWRPDGYGFGEPVEREEEAAFVSEIVKIVLSRQSYTAGMLCDLVSRLISLTSEDQKRVWEIINAWRKTGISDEEIAKVREKIRVMLFSRLGRKRADEKGQAVLTKQARQIYKAMQPKDVVNKHAWLFHQGWVDGAVDELAEEDMNFQVWERRIEKLRVKALTEIMQDSGIPGIFSLATKGNTQCLIGELLVSSILDDEQIEDMILQCIRSESEDAKRNDIIAGALRALESDRYKAIYANLRCKLTDAEALNILLLSPYCALIWSFVNQLSTDMRSHYWHKVDPHILHSPAENNEGIHYLLAAKRPRAAFALMRFRLEEIQPALLVQVLMDIAKGGGEDKSEESPLHDDNILRAFQLLHRNPDISLEEKAGLEFAYLDVLARPFHGEDKHQIPNLERYIEEHPEMFVQAIVWAYKRKNGGNDPSKFRIGEEREHLAERGYRLLEAIERIPGQDRATTEEKSRKLAEWVSIVRQSCAELDRENIADICIGKLLSHSPVGEDGVWPNEVVRDLMEDVHSEDIMNGARTGIYNARGVYWRGDGGKQERELAEKYQNWANALQFTHSFVSSFLMSIVEIYEKEAKEQDAKAKIRRRRN